MRRPMFRNLVMVAFAILIAAGPVAAKSPFSLVRFTRNKNVAKSSSLLTEENGPWMIFAASFAGPGAENEARALVQELRSDYKLNAYLHKKNYDYSDGVEGKGYDKYGHPKRMRYATDGAFDEVAVLIGDYPSIDDGNMQKDMKEIKSAQPKALNLEGKQNSTLRFAGLRNLQKKLTGDKDRARRGPMFKAFATRNPMSPKLEMADGLDPLLVNINKDGKYSLLKCPGKYSVRIASYRGEVVIDQAKVQELEGSKKLSSRLVEAGEKAEQLAVLLRKKRIEAYVFHDRHESIVTVGSFDSIGNDRPNGTIELNSGVAQIMETYGPSKKRLQGDNGVAFNGIQPKSFDKSGKYIFDVAPQPVIVPRRSIGNDYLSSAR